MSNGQVFSRLLWQPILLGRGRRILIVQLERPLLQDLGDATVVGLQFHLELVQLLVQLSEIAINQTVALFGVLNDNLFQVNSCPKRELENVDSNLNFFTRVLNDLLVFFANLFKLFVPLADLELLAIGKELLLSLFETVNAICKDKRWSEPQIPNSSWWSPSRRRGKSISSMPSIWFRHLLWTERSISRISVNLSLSSDGRCSITAMDESHILRLSNTTSFNLTGLTAVSLPLRMHTKR